MSYYGQNFDSEIVGDLPAGWTKGSHASIFTIVSNDWSISSPNSLRHVGYNSTNKQSGFNLPFAYADETIRFKLKLPPTPPVPTYITFTLNDVDFTGANVTLVSSLFYFRFNKSSMTVYRGSYGSNVDTSYPFSWGAEIDVRIEIAADLLSLYFDDNLVYSDVIPTISSALRCLIIEGDLSQYLYIDDFQIGESPPVPINPILKDVTITNTHVEV
jgi:hypothetical protein